MNLRNEIILASAGTGKTFTLSDRIVRLLALGAPSESIVALTFTRKAAAEFTSAVFRKLAEACESDARAEAVRVRLGLPNDVSFPRILRALVRNMDRLQFGTFDSFFQRIAAAIPFELGLPGIEILDELAAATARERVLLDLIRAGRPAAEQDALIEAFRQATWGAEEKNLHRAVGQLVKTFHGIYLGASDPRLWGGEEVIWPGEICAWLQPPGDITADLSLLRDWAESESGQFFTAFGRFLRDIAEWSPGMDLPSGALVERIIGAFAADQAPECVEIAFGKGVRKIPPALVPSLGRVVHRLVGATFERALRMTRGIHGVLSAFEKDYDSNVRMAGRLVFGDVPSLLHRVDSLLWQERLDARVSHWLFDEFQDTSVSQWAVIENVLDEVLQDPSGARSAFFVGDPKQSIYRWRGGEHRLIGALARRYGAGIDMRSLRASYRSAPRVIEFVNRVGNSLCECDGLLPKPAIEEWRAGWEAHTSAITSTAGHVAVHQIEGGDALHDAIHERLCAIDPIGRRLTCAILTRSNSEAREIAHALRAKGFLDVVSETDESVAMDNPVTGAFVALFRAILHPADGASRHYVEMTPIGEWVAAAGWEATRQRLLEQLSMNGFEAVLDSLYRELQHVLPGDAFSRRRLSQLRDIARAFDSGNPSSITEFPRFAAEFTHRDAAASGRVQLMTVHKSKGLGFDVVLLPVLDTQRMDSATDAQLLAPAGISGRTQWILRKPPTLIAAADPIIAAACDADRADNAYEAMCLLYVAITRAKFALEIFVPKTPENVSALSPVAAIHRAIAPRDEDAADWAIGDPTWFEHVESPVVSDAGVLSVAAWACFKRVTRLDLIRPSATGGLLRGTPLSRPAADFGAAAHKALAEIEWLSSPAPPDMPTEDEAVRQALAHCLENPNIARWFHREQLGDVAWRERAFDVLLDGKWVSGIFDRVVIRSAGAILLEFKTDNAPPEHVLERHRPQLELYRSALAKLLGLDSVKALLVHVPTAVALDVD
jgi:ATP-dependent exoDNAse (exonuclease V) beta subunit